MNAFKQDLQNQPEARKNQIMKQPVMAMIFSRFTIDFQRVFKDRENNRGISSDGASLQRSQISVIVHNIQIKDLTPNSHYPMVFDCNSDRSVFDLCIRLRGPLSADMLKVDLFDLNLAHENGNSEKMSFTTSEDYVWRILDLVNRILAASGEVSGFTLKYENDENDNAEPLENLLDHGITCLIQAGWGPSHRDRSAPSAPGRWEYYRLRSGGQRSF